VRYVVSGVRDATRDAVHRADLTVPACARATHFVSQIAVGAFQLQAGDGHVNRGGDLASCVSADKEACRVPIRVTLRPILDGAK
jgi:hypothetical protein